MKNPLIFTKSRNFGLLKRSALGGPFPVNAVKWSRAKKDAGTGNNEHGVIEMEGTGGLAAADHLLR